MATKTFNTNVERIALEDYAEARAALEVAKTREEAAKAVVLALAGDADEVRVDGMLAFTAKESTSLRFDVTRFKAERPADYTAYLVSSVSRRFLWKGLPRLVA